MARRSGFTLLEVVIASVVLAISLTGIGAMGFHALSKTRTPGNMETASLLATERLSYYRAQQNPYVAVGGTYYPPPETRLQGDRNSPPLGNPLHNVRNGAPALFIREYLADTSQTTYREDRYGRSGTSSGADAAKAQFSSSQVVRANQLGSLGLNEIPASPLAFDLNNDGVAEPLSGYWPNTESASFAQPSAALTATGYTNSMIFVRAPRANAGLVNGSDLPANIGWVREVWIQTNQPSFSTDQWAGSLASLNTAVSGVNPPPLVSGLPPFVVAATVRVFERDAQTGKIALGAEPADGIRNTTSPPYTGPGYNRRRPLATAVGYFGLWRTLRY